MKLNEIDVGYKKGLYTLAFVYSRDNENILIKGQQDLVTAVIEKDYTPCVANFQRFSGGKSTSWWVFFVTDSYNPVYISTPNAPWSSKVSNLFTPRRNKFKFTCYLKKSHGPSRYKISLSLRRIPKKWIPEYQKLLIKR